MTGDTDMEPGAGDVTGDTSTESGARGVTGVAGSECSDARPGPT